MSEQNGTNVQETEKKVGKLKPRTIKHMKYFSYALNTWGALCMIGAFFLHAFPKLVGWMSMICFAVHITMLLAFPQYFHVIESTENLSKKEKKRLRNQNNIFYSTLFSIFGMILPSFHMNFLSDWLWLTYSLITALLLIGIVSLLKHVFKRQIAAGALIVLLAFSSLGLVTQVNYLLDFHPKEIQSGVVTDTHRSHTRRTSTYTCEIRAADGEMVKLRIRLADYSRLNEGDRVFFATCKGALGLSYRYLL